MELAKYFAPLDSITTIIAPVKPLLTNNRISLSFRLYPHLWALGAITCVGAVLRLIQLNSDLWLDEVVSLVSYFRLSPTQAFFAYDSPNQHLLYSMLASLSISCFGESAWAARLPSAVLGAASIPAIYYLALKVAPPRAALLSAALLALSYHHIWFSQSARGYTGMVLCTLVGTSLLLGARRSGLWLWLPYALVMAVGIGFVQNTLFVLMGHFFAVLLIEKRIGREQFVATLVSLGLSILFHAGVLGKIVHFWLTEERTGWGSGVGSLSGLIGLFARGLSAGFLVPGAILLVAVAVLGWLRLWRKDRFIAFLFLMPSLLGFVAVVLLKYGAYPRAFLHLLPFVLVTIAYSATSGSGRFKAVLPTFLLICSALSLGFLYRYPKQDYNGALASVRRHTQAGDSFAGAGMAGGVYQMYYAPEITPIRTVDQLKQLEATSNRVWVIFSFTRDMRLRFSPLYDYLEAHYETVSRHPGTLDDGTLYVVRRR